jgi:hypothetical protein
MTTEFKDNFKEFLDAMENAIKNGLTAAEHKYKTRAEKILGAEFFYVKF